jgi:hypothetical protein
MLWLALRVTSRWVRRVSGWSSRLLFRLLYSPHLRLASPIPTHPTLFCKILLMQDGPYLIGT